MGSNRQKLTPEFEHDLARDPRLGYEIPDASGFVRCIEHGSPTPLERWHFHDEYELHLIIGARGRAFVGDYIGHFEPGHLVLTGPRLPHNWISSDLPPDGLAVRSLVIQFHEEPLREGMQAIRELGEIAPLLERAQRGIEFFGLSDDVRERFYRIKRSQGLERFAEFVGLLSLLQRCNDFRLLSLMHQTGSGAVEAHLPIDTVLDYVNENYTEAIELGHVAARVNMSQSGFSRYFSKATGSNFTTFVNRLRIHKACELLMNSDSQITSICYAVGFNNVANFNRRFRDVKQVTPGNFRRQAMARLGGSALSGSPVKAELNKPAVPSKLKKRRAAEAPVIAL